MDGKHGLRQESNFDFKYIPDLHKTTQKEDGDKSGIQQSGIETRNLQALVVGSGLILALTYAGFTLARGVLRNFGVI